MFITKQEQARRTDTVDMQLQDSRPKSS